MRVALLRHFLPGIEGNKSAQGAPVAAAELEGLARRAAGLDLRSAQVPGLAAGFHLGIGPEKRRNPKGKAKGIGVLLGQIVALVDD